MLDRLELLSKLDALAKTRPARAEAIRKSRVLDELDAAVQSTEPRRRSIQTVENPVIGLPAGIHLAEAGKLNISFDSPEELLGRILALAECAARDYSSFASQISGGGDGNS